METTPDDDRLRLIVLSEVALQALLLGSLLRRSQTEFNTAYSILTTTDPGTPGGPEWSHHQALRSATARASLEGFALRQALVVEFGLIQAFLHSNQGGKHRRRSARLRARG